MAVHEKLIQHIEAVKNDERVFENAFQSVARMILGSGFEKVVVNGRTTYDFKVFHQRVQAKHPSYNNYNDKSEFKVVVNK